MLTNLWCSTYYFCVSFITLLTKKYIFFFWKEQIVNWFCCTKAKKKYLKFSFKVSTQSDICTTQIQNNKIGQDRYKDIQRYVHCFQSVYKGHEKTKKEVLKQKCVLIFKSWITLSIGIAITINLSLYYHHKVYALKVIVSSCHFWIQFELQTTTKFNKSRDAIH